MPIGMDMIEALFLIVLGPLALFAGGVLLMNQQSLSRKGVKTQGVAKTVDLADTEGGEHVGVGYANVIEFFTEEGTSYQFRSTAASRKNIDSGRNLEVIYLPGKPETATINNFFQRWLLSYSLLILGICSSIYASQILFLS